MEFQKIAHLYFRIWKKLLSYPIGSRALTQVFQVGRQIKYKRKKLTTVSEVKKAVADIADYFAITPMEGFRFMDSFYFEPQLKHSSDPYSLEYKQEQLDLYYELSGKNDYHPATDENTPFNFDEYLASPFPYNSGAPSVIGDHIIAYGNLIKSLNLRKGCKILDMGIGAGETSLMFARAGYEVTAVDINPDLVALVQHKAKDMRLNMNVIVADMTEFDTSEKFDAIVFHESFHHCIDHYELLKKLVSWRRYDGIIAFSAEPVDYFRLPWGLRMDGQSLWAIVNFGWMELGFAYNYFFGMTKKLKLSVTMNRNLGSDNATVYVCR